jgi:hypothetical protein
MNLEWSRVPGTSNWQLVDTDARQVMRLVAERGPQPGEPDGPKFEVTGDGHGTSTHSSLGDAKSAALTSLLVGR